MGFMGMYPEIWTKLAIIIPVYVIRTAIINSAAPLQKSILMDYVPKANPHFCVVVKIGPVCRALLVVGA